MSWVSVLQALALLTAADTAPLFAELIFRERFGCRLDFGIVLRDGQPLFGRSKLFEGSWRPYS